MFDKKMNDKIVRDRGGTQCRANGAACLSSSSFDAMFPCAANDDSDRWYGYYEVRMAHCAKKFDLANISATHSRET